MNDFIVKNSYDIADLLKIMELLRSENGCPWDREQNHGTIRNNLLEEAYEVVDAIDIGDPHLQEEELGDVLLQVVFHCRIEAEENGGYDFDSVCDTLSKKLIERHPHVFGDISVDGSDDVLKNWDKIKKETKSQSFTQTLRDIPKAMPALVRAEKIGKRAARAGMDFNCAEDALECVRSECAELDEAMRADDLDLAREELGDLLFSCVNTARKLGIDAEEALALSCGKFIERFEQTEKLVAEDGLEMPSLNIEILDTYWDKAKKKINSERDERK